MKTTSRPHGGRRTVSQAGVAVGCRMLGRSTQAGDGWWIGEGGQDSRRVVGSRRAAVWICRTADGDKRNTAGDAQEGRWKVRLSTGRMDTLRGG